MQLSLNEVTTLVNALKELVKIEKADLSTMRKWCTDDMASLSLEIKIIDHEALLAKLVREFCATMEQLDGRYVVTLPEAQS